MKRLSLLAALPLLCASVASATPLMSVGYFNSGGDVTAGPGGDINTLDVRQITHLNYSFGLVYNDEKDETHAALKDPAKLHQIWLSPKVAADLALIPTLRKQNPDLKVLLSVGGWGARGFSGAAATQESRAVFIRSAQEIVEKYALDGIDLDWEYPVNGAWGLVASTPADRDNFTALLKELRTAFGHKKLVTIAVGANAESPKSWVDVKAIAPLLDYINLMTYDMAYGTQYFNANLYDSSDWPTVAAADKYSVDFVVNNYLAAGLKPQQMNLGIGFYGRVPKRAVEPGIDWTKPGCAKPSGDPALLWASGNRLVRVTGLRPDQRYVCEVQRYCEKALKRSAEAFYRTLGRAGASAVAFSECGGRQGAVCPFL